MSEGIKPELIEKAAIAAYEEVQRPNWRAPLWDEIDELGRERFLNATRAALEAVAEDMRRDEYHTMDELYEYRMLYNALAANALAHLAVKSWRHSDGELCFGGGWFVVYLNLPTGQVSNHYKAEHWDLFNVPEEDTAPEYDGHTPAEAAERLKAAAPALEAVYADIKAKAEAWDEGAEAAWERSAPEVNGQTHHWRHEGEPLNPYRDDRIEPRGTNE